MSHTFEAVARKLMENETAIGQLYELFGHAFVPDAELWARLAEEEYQHAEWIRRALEAVTPERRQQGLLSIRLPAIESMIQHVESIVERCRRNELTRIGALALARDLESSLLESKLLGTLSSGAGRFEVLEKALVQATGDHRKRIVDALDRVRHGG